ncbi:MAG: sulfotransferase [Chromatiaceae bacterium]
MSESRETGWLGALGHPLALSPFRHWLGLLRSGGGVDPKYYGRAAFITAVSAIATTGRIRERYLVSRRLRDLHFREDPLFIVGHWRCGTTFLHNLFCQDRQFSYVTTLQSQAPKAFFANYWLLRRIMPAFMPNIRPMDNMPVDVDSPQEEEFCLSNACPHSFYLWLYFPRAMEDRFEKYVLFEGVSDEERAEWSREYIEMLKKASAHMEGKPLVLKNPCNTARIDQLRRLFPHAKFIHIYRNPYIVYRSTVRLWQKLQPLLALQHLDPETLDSLVLTRYRLMMERYFQQRELIPDESIAEVRYEDLVSQPLSELHRLYEHLHLDGWENAKPDIERYVNSLAGYRASQYRFTQDEIEKVERYCGLAIERFEYERPQTV